MATLSPSTERIHGYCALCVSRCGSIAVVEDGRFVALEPDPSHPTGRRSAPRDGRPRAGLPPGPAAPSVEADASEGRSGSGLAADRLGRSARARPLTAGASPVSTARRASCSASSRRRPRRSDDLVLGPAFACLRHAESLVSMELCGWGRYLATTYTCGARVPGTAMPDLEHAGCILFWGYNPSLARLSHATATVAALERGAASSWSTRARWAPARADLWLRVRPGSDGALALGHRARDDRARLVRSTLRARLDERPAAGPLRRRPLAGRGRPLAPRERRALRGLERGAGRPVPTTPTGGIPGPSAARASAAPRSTRREARSPAGPPSSARGICRRYPPERGRDDLRGPARQSRSGRPTAVGSTAGRVLRLERRRAADERDPDRPGDRAALRPDRQLRVPRQRAFPTAPSANGEGEELLSAGQRTRTLGLHERPLGPARGDCVTTDELYRAILDQRPLSRARAGRLRLQSAARPRRSPPGTRRVARRSISTSTPTFHEPDRRAGRCRATGGDPLRARGAEGRIRCQPGGAVAGAAAAAVVEPLGEARPMPNRLRSRLPPRSRRPFLGAAISTRPTATNSVRPASRGGARGQSPGGVRRAASRRATASMPRRTAGYRRLRHAHARIQVYSETFLEHGYSPLPDYEDRWSVPRSRPDLAARYPLLLTCAKHATSARASTAASRACARRTRDPRWNCIRPRRRARGSRRATGCPSRRRRSVRAWAR